MKNCLLIIPYFGFFPNYFQLFLNSCGFNKNIDFLIFTDDRRTFNYPNNVYVKYCEFDNIRELVRKKIDPEVTLDNVMKLCDFRPAYGYLFQDYVNGYKYWGHCDIDLIFGDLDAFITPMINESYYDKIFNLGHLTLYRNRDDINNLFMEEIKENIKNSVFFKSSLCKFDEENHPGSIVKYAVKNKLNIYTKQLEADIATKSNRLILDEYDFFSNTHRYLRQRNLFLYDKGQIKRFYLCGNKVEMQEYAYIHLQKRKMDVDFNPINGVRSYVIAANKFYIPSLSLNDINRYKFENIKTLFINPHYLSLRWKNLKIKLRKILKLI